jgi:hypothetical protein
MRAKLNRLDSQSNPKKKAAKEKPSLKCSSGLLPAKTFAGGTTQS